MYEQVMFHWMIEMLGAGTFGCLAYGCKNAAHKHNRFMGFFVYNKWVRRTVFILSTILSSFITVHLVG